MKKATIRIRRDVNAAIEEMSARFVDAWKSGRSAGDTLQFESPAALFRVLTPKRWELVELLQKLGPSSVRGLARKLEHDVKRVHDDVVELIRCGLIARQQSGKFHVPYDLIHADFDLRAVA